jgi:hypothetical protein
LSGRKAGLSYVYFAFHPAIITPRRLMMSFLRSPSLKPQDTKVESLQTQFDYLSLLRRRHVHWMNSAASPEIEGKHRAIVELIEQISDQYSRLIDALK